MRIIIFLSLLIFGLGAFAQEFDCLSATSMKIQPEYFYQVHGTFLTHSDISNVTASLAREDNTDRHEIFKSEQTFSSVKSFHPQSNKLIDFKKFILDKDKEDSLFLFLPEKIQNSHFLAYLKISFEGTFPKLELLNCTY